MNNSRYVCGLVCVLLLAASLAGATTIVMPADEQLIAKSPVIVEGTVLSTTPVDRNGVVWTETVVRVSRTIKGATDATITIAEEGGMLEDRATKIFGAPEYAAGDRVLVFLERDRRGDYRTMDLFVGKFTEGQTADGRRLWLRHDEADHVTLLNADFQPIRARNVQRDAALFETFVADRIAGRAGNANYGIENPVLRRQRDIGADFTLIDEPTVFRWAIFDNGQTANWYSHGTQPGYAGGGLSEVATALAAWNGYASAKISYAYAGAASGQPGGLSGRNNINEILLNDPLGEIAGSWNRTSGGVVGKGGFTSVGTSANWTAPFAADAAHPAGVIRVWNIAEGNLVIQDGVSSSAGISSGRLAEIISHEFGHTLGLGHSPDAGALMYANVTGLGPALREDDKLAARWLYPNGDTTGPQPTLQPPAAPSNLTATTNGTSVALQWSDNASNETTQSIYVSAGTAAFMKIGDATANARTATVNGFAVGSYRVYVTASNSAGQSAASNTVSFSITQQVTASFSFTPQTGTAGVTYFTFYDESSGPVSSRMWNFGDGATSTAAVATHAYATPGQYTVTLSVSGGGTQSQTTRTVGVAGGLASAFTFTPASPTTNELVFFSDQSTGGVTGWFWTFGDGDATPLQNPTHRYARPGTYTVTLTINRNSESRFSSKTIVVRDSSAVQPAVKAFESLVSATAQTTGIGGTSWRTELTVFNAGEDAFADFIFLPADGSIRTKRVFIGAQQSVTYLDALGELYGLTTGAGAIAIRATNPSSTPKLKVASRTFTSGSVGTYGQGVPDVTSTGLMETLYVAGMASNDGYRTNVGLVNRTDADVAATLTLVDGSGGTIATANVTVAKNSFRQTSLASLFPSTSGRSYDVLSMTVRAAVANAVSVYASVVDNLTQDPIYLQAVPAPDGNSLMLPVVGRAPGANSTYWRSDVALFNPGSDRRILSLDYLGTTKSLALNGGDTIVLADVLAQMGVAQGSGALEISWSGSPGPVVTSRTYTTSQGGGTYGQSIDPIAAFASEAFVPGLRMTSGYRSNVGFVNGGDTPMSIDVRLVSPEGVELARTTLSIAPKAQSQYPVAALFPGANAAGTFTLTATASTPNLFAYGSMVDNDSGDPVFFPGR